MNPSRLSLKRSVRNTDTGSRVSLSPQWAANLLRNGRQSPDIRRLQPQDVAFGLLVRCPPPGQLRTLRIGPAHQRRRIQQPAAWPPPSSAFPCSRTSKAVPTTTAPHLVVSPFRRWYPIAPTEAGKESRARTRAGSAAEDRVSIFKSMCIYAQRCSSILRAKGSLRKMFSSATATSYYGGVIQSRALSAFDLRHSTSSSDKASIHVITFKVRSFTHSSLGGSSGDQEIVIAMGSNVGDRVSTFDRALQMMKTTGINITRHACLYETAPAYVTDQPRFLNSAIRGTTRLGPHELLKKLKEIEKDIGRTGGIRYGPRPIDLDILLYGNSQIATETLVVPHERIHERPFVLAPLVDLLGASADNAIETSWHSLSKSRLFELWNKLGGESVIGTEGIKRVLPIGNHLLDWSERTLIMGILNLTPDSFSDGGKFQPVEAAISQAKLLISEGADIIDIGAQSTRPFARRLSPNEELERLVPVLDEVTKIPEMEGRLLSIDTFYAEVAIEAVKRGVHMINDVFGGQLDPRILKVAAELGVPYVIMHIRGDPSTMQSEKNLQYGDICKEVASELYKKLREAELSGIPPWRIVLDPGIGFSKKTRHNLEIIKGLESIRREIGKMSMGASHVLMLLGPSWKSFLGEICNRSDPVERDVITAVAVADGIMNGANIVRVHNVGYSADAVKYCAASRKGRRWET